MGSSASTISSLPAGVPPPPDDINAALPAGVPPPPDDITAQSTGKSSASLGDKAQAMWQGFQTAPIMHPINTAQQIESQIMHPGQAVDDMEQGREQSVQRAINAKNKGNYTAAAIHGVLSLIPYAGPALSQHYQEMRDAQDSGDEVAEAKAAGKMLGIAASTEVARNAPEIAGGLKKVASAAPEAAANSVLNTLRATKGAVQGAMTPVGHGGLASSVPASAAGALGGGYVASRFGVPYEIGAGIGALAPAVKGAINAFDTEGQAAEFLKDIPTIKRQTAPVPPIRPMAQPDMPTAPVPPVRFNQQPIAAPVPPPPIRWSAPPSPVNTAAIPPVKWNTSAATAEPTGIPGVPTPEDLAARGVSRYTPPPRINPQAIAQPSAPPQVTGQSLVPPEHPYQTQLAPEAANPTRAGVATGEASRAGARTVWARGMARRLYDSGKGITPQDAATLQPAQLDPLASEAGLTPASLRSPETMQQMLQELGNLWKRGQE